MKPRIRRRPPVVSLVVEEPGWRKDASVCALVRRAARLALAAVPQRAAGPSRDVAILLAGDAKLRELNHMFRGRNKPTNVLSFPSSPELDAHIGDIALAFGVIAKEARAQEKPLAAHAAHLAIHGVLHLLGYDHAEDREAARMEALETKLVQRLGFSDPYAPVRCTGRRKAA